MTPDLIDKIVAEVDIESDLFNHEGTNHAIDVCPAHEGVVQTGDIVNTACGMLMRWIPRDDKCERCMNAPTGNCHVCGIALVE